jgi:heme A synthase
MGVVAVVLLALAVGAIVAGFDAALYAEYGGRPEGPERPFPCTPQEDGSCVDPTQIERQAQREPRLAAKLNSVGALMGLIGLILLVAGLVCVGAWIRARRRLHGTKVAAPAAEP